MTKAKDADMVPFGSTELSRQDLESMSFQNLLNVGVIDISEVDDVIAVEQGELVGKPFILFDWTVKDSDKFGGTYATCRVKTTEGTRVFADGGVGIQEALERYAKKLTETPDALLYFHYGLRFSTYTKDIDGTPTQATTYYFDNRQRP